MFINEPASICTNSEERQRGRYLQLVQSSEFESDDYGFYRAVVRTVTVVPFGNFSAVSKVVIGATAYNPLYGSLIIVPHAVWEQAVSIPANLEQRVQYYGYSDEARQQLIEWARGNLPALVKPIRIER